MSKAIQPILSHPGIKPRPRPVDFTDYGWFVAQVCQLSADEIRKQISARCLFAKRTKRMGAVGLVQHDYKFDEMGQLVTD